MISVSIGQVKRDISELVNRVAYGGEQVILTSRGKPKAMLIGIEEYQRLTALDKNTDKAQWQAWLERVDRNVEEILARRQGEMIDVDAILAASRADLETRNDFLLAREDGR